MTLTKDALTLLLVLNIMRGPTIYVRYHKTFHFNQNENLRKTTKQYVTPV